MLKDLDHDQRALAEYMSELSEQAYAAGWMVNLEHALWRAVEHGPYRYGNLQLTVDHVEALKRLSATCRGWICFRASDEETFVSIDQWLRIHGSTGAV